MLHDLNNLGTPPPISFKPNPEIGNKPGKKQESVKVDIKTHPREINIEMIFLNILTFNTDLVKSLLKFLVQLKIFKGQNLTMDSHHNQVHK